MDFLSGLLAQLDASLKGKWLREQSCSVGSLVVCSQFWHHWLSGPLNCVKCGHILPMLYFWVNKHKAAFCWTKAQHTVHYVCIVWLSKLKSVLIRTGLFSDKNFISTNIGQPKVCQIAVSVYLSAVEFAESLVSLIVPNSVTLACISNSRNSCNANRTGILQHLFNLNPVLNLLIESDSFKSPFEHI